MKKIKLLFLLFFLAQGASAVDAIDVKKYQILPGDILHVSVWEEAALEADIVVRPDGGITFPLVGEIITSNMTIMALAGIIKEKLGKYIPDPEVTVTARQLLGNKIYVLGQVNRPGEFVVNKNVDVLQALSMAGGLTAFAATSEMRIIRRNDDKQVLYAFNYNEIGDKNKLDQNIILKSGDVIFVP